MKQEYITEITRLANECDNLSTLNLIFQILKKTA